MSIFRNFRLVLQYCNNSLIIGSHCYEFLVKFRHSSGNFYSSKLKHFRIHYISMKCHSLWRFIFIIFKFIKYHDVLLPFFGTKFSYELTERLPLAPAAATAQLLYFKTHDAAVFCGLCAR